MSDEEPSIGPSKRVQQLNSLVQKEVAELLGRDVDWPVGSLVTVTKVEVTDDAENAKVWLSVLPETFDDKVMTVITAKIRDIQTLLNKKLVMKFVPKLTFVIDHSETKAEQVIRKLDELEHEMV